MNRICLLLVSLFLFGCTGMSKDGEICFEFQTFEVLQGLEGGALAYECPWYEEMCFTRPVVYLTSPQDVDYYDEQSVSSSSITCWIQDGVYRYTNKNDIMKTVPRLKLVEKMKK